MFNYVEMLAIYKLKLVKINNEILTIYVFMNRHRKKTRQKSIKI